MSGTPRTGGSASLLTGLLNRGIGGVLEGPIAAVDVVADPADLPGWRRIGLLAGLRREGPSTRPGPVTTTGDLLAAAPGSLSATGVLATGDPRAGGLLQRSARYVLLGPIAFRVVAVSLALVTVLMSEGLTRLPGLDAIAVAVIVLDVALLVRALLDPAFVRRSLGRWVAADIVVAIAANLAVSVTTSGALHGDATSVTWLYLAGTAALVTTAWGGLAGLGMIGVAAGLQAVMGVLNRQHSPTGAHLPVTDSAFGAVVWIAVAVIATLVGLTLLGLGIRLAMMTGVKAGREAERTRMLRGMHDTVLQSLEAMAMASPRDQVEPAWALADLRAQARSQARQIRRVLAQLSGENAARGLVDEITDVTAEMAAVGLRTELVAADLDDHELDATEIAALRGAVRESLRNVLKHSGTTAALVRIDADADGLEVIVRDHGCGFDLDACVTGFGLPQSISARMAEVGALAEITSQPGRGTRVRLRVPR